MSALATAPQLDEEGWAMEFAENGAVSIPTEEEESLFTDLAPFLDGTFKQEIPSVGLAYRDTHLFYAGRLNEIHAEPAVGKTNVLMAACVSVLEDGGKVLYIDPEDTPQGFATRMLALHGSPDDIRENVFYLHNPSHDQIRTAQQWAQENHPDIVVLDGLAESMAAVGSDENKAADVLGFFRETLRPFAEAGAAVVIADHVTKSSENRGQFARGSGAKAGRYDGVSYEVAPAMQYTPTQAGFVRLKIQKDRNGGAGPRGKIVAELHFTPGVDGRTITAFRQPEQSEGPFRPTVYMEKIVKHIELYGTSTQSNLRKVGGKSQYIDKAIEVLLNEKTIGFHKVGQSHQYFLITPKGGVCSSVPTVFHACSELEEQPCSPVPPPMGGTGGTVSPL